MIGLVELLLNVNVEYLSLTGYNVESFLKFLIFLRHDNRLASKLLLDISSSGSLELSSSPLEFEVDLDELDDEVLEVIEQLSFVLGISLEKALTFYLMLALRSCYKFK